MRTLVFPGFSVKNKDWAEETKFKLDPFSPTTAVFWDHWNGSPPGKDWIKSEVVKILKIITDEKVDIVAKSIGTLVTCHILKAFPEKINKLILCGIPLKDMGKDDLTFYAFLKNIPVENILCIQNEEDNHATYPEVNKFLSAIDNRIKIVSKSRNDHEYPYSEDFINFLK